MAYQNYYETKNNVYIYMYVYIFLNKVSNLMRIYKYSKKSKIYISCKVPKKSYIPQVAM